MIISLIAAVAENGVIGRNGDLPWRIPSDLKRFNDITRGHTVIMGRKTFESIGKPLPGRRNIVLTRRKDYQAEGCMIAHDLAAAFAACAGEAEVFIGGGGQVYAETIHRADRIYLTRVKATVEGDTFFPEMPDDFTGSEQDRAEDVIPTSFLVYTRQREPAFGGGKEEQRYAVFLTPSPDDFAYLDGLIRKMSANYDCDPFEPHVTVYAGSSADLAPVRAVLEAAASGQESIDLHVTGIGFSEEYFKTLFIEFVEHSTLRRIHEMVRDASACDSGYRLAPHLSLLYRDMPLKEKEEAARQLRLERSVIRFDGLKIVTPANRERGWADTGRWTSLFSVSLAGVSSTRHDPYHTP